MIFVYGFRCSDNVSQQRIFKRRIVVRPVASNFVNFVILASSSTLLFFCCSSRSLLPGSRRKSAASARAPDILEAQQPRLDSFPFSLLGATPPF